MPPHALLKDVYPRVKDIMTGNVISAYPDDPICSIVKHIEEDRIRIISIIDTNRSLQGVVSFSQLAEFYFSTASIAKPMHLFKPDNFNSTIPRQCIHRGQTDEFEGEIMIGAMDTSTSIDVLKKVNPNKTVLIVGNRKCIIEFAIQNNFAAIIITGSSDVPYNISHYTGWIYVSELDTFNTLRLLTLSIPCRYIMKASDTVSPDITVQQAKEKLLKYEYRGLPVCEENILKGIITRSDIIKYFCKKAYSG